MSCLGVNPENEKHKHYLKEMTENFVEVMHSRIGKAIEEHAMAGKADSLYEECIQHISFCQTKCDSFYGRRDTLQVAYNRRKLYPRKLKSKLDQFN